MKGQIKILVVDDDETVVDACTQVLQKEKYRVAAARTGEEGLRLFSEELFHAVLLDLKMPGLDGISVLQSMKEAYPEIPVIIITGYASIESAVDAIKKGAFDYLAKPFTPVDLRQVVQKALKNRDIVLENIYLRGEVESKSRFDMVVGESRVMGHLAELIKLVAPTESTILITGESGTGKELLAREIHKQSSRAGAPFVVVDCGALVETLFESELFGHTKGSFTGAYETKHGRFEIADGGTIFLDEIGNIGLNIQAKLLRTIQEKEITRVGSSSPIKIAATNENLENKVREGKFREDLYYRLSVVPMALPPLRERKEDIPLLTEHFIRKCNQKMKKKIGSISPQVRSVLMQYDWPGNIRELENTIERAIVLSHGNTIEIENLMYLGLSLGSAPAPASARPFPARTLEQVEKEYIKNVMEAMGGHRSRAAKALGVDRKTLWAKLKKYNLE
jgi:DNA-binding NtrC family response regulator